jgi:inorganic triphosphatase YgiF
MADGLETELKLAASPAVLDALRDHPLLAAAPLADAERDMTLVTRYFDTADGALHRAGASLRLRECGAEAEQTFKHKAHGDGGLRRGEWNVPAIAAEPDPAAFPTEPRMLLQDLLGGAWPVPLAATHITRTTRRLRFGASTIEAAFDRGTIEAGGHSEPACELELELIEGDAADLFALARQLPLGPELGWSVASKAERGHALALRLPFSAVRAGDIPLTPAMSVGEGFRAIAWNCLAQLLGNYRAVIAGGDPDAVHQSRVAIRRLRAAFSLFGAAVADDHTAPFRAEWKAAAAGLGPVRDLDVLIERIAASGDANDDLLASLRARRAAALGEAQALLAGSQFQQLLLGFAEWLERDMPPAPAPLAPFAAEVLRRRRRKLVRGEALASLPDEALHALRIQGKKLRYAVEFFAALYPGERRRAFGKALGKLQEALGGVHDLAVAQHAPDALFADLDPIAAAGHAAQLSALLAAHGPKRKRLIAAAAKALDRVAHAPAWWKARKAAPPAAAD